MIQIHPKIEQMGGVKWNIGMTQEAERATKLHTERMNKSRRLPRQLREVDTVSESMSVHIFNVGPFTERVFLGTWGDVTIPACPAGTDYVYVCKVPGVYVETIPGEDKFDGEQVSGSYIAQEILGEGPDLRNYRGESRKRTGLFMGSVRGPGGDKPLPEEVESAKEAVAQYLHELVLEANGAWGSGNDAEFKSQVGSKHYLAAQLTGQTDVPWFKAKLAPKKEALVNCPNCGTEKSPKYPTCKECGHRDEELYQKLFGGKKEPSAAEQEVQRLRAENEALGKKK